MSRSPVDRCCVVFAPSLRPGRAGGREAAPCVVDDLIRSVSSTPSRCGQLLSAFRAAGAVGPRWGRHEDRGDRFRRRHPAAGDKVCHRQLCKYPTRRVVPRTVRTFGPCASIRGTRWDDNRRGQRLGSAPLFESSDQADSAGNQSAISRSADSGESEPCTRLFWVFSA